MLEKLSDAKNTFEGKALAVFMSLVMVLSFINFSSFADAAENGTSPDAPEAQADDPSSEPAETPAPESAPSAEPEAAAPAEIPEASEPPAQSEATVPPASEPEPDLPTAEPGVAVVGVELDHAYLVVADQEIALPLTSSKHRSTKISCSRSSLTAATRSTKLWRRAKPTGPRGRWSLKQMDLTGSLPRK